MRTGCYLFIMLAVACVCSSSCKQPNDAILIPAKSACDKLVDTTCAESKSRCREVREFLFRHMTAGSKEESLTTEFEQALYCETILGDANELTSFKKNAVWVSPPIESVHPVTTTAAAIPSESVSAQTIDPSREVLPSTRAVKLIFPLGFNAAHAPGQRTPPPPPVLRTP